jgi:micrococcal nuclease
VLRRRTRHGNVDRTHLTPRPALTFAAALCAAAILVPACSRDTSANDSETTTLSNEGVVVSVSDGDTITVAIDGSREKVRLIGVDTPETKHPTKGVQCWGPEASDFTTRMLPVGTRVRLVRDVEARDRYRRLLAYVYLADTDLFFNLELVRLGYARPYPFPPNTTHKADFAAAAWDAQQSERGLWAKC